MSNNIRTPKIVRSKLNKVLKFLLCKYIIVSKSLVFLVLLNRDNHKINMGITTLHKFPFVQT